MGAGEDPIDVAIIGAGLSGLTAARDLDRAGCTSFFVLEARNRVGGRTYNHDLGGGVISEGGGEWIGPGQTAIADLARELRVAVFDSFYRGRSVYLRGNERIEEDHGDGGLTRPSVTIGRLNALAREVPSEAPWEAAQAAELDELTLADWLACAGCSPAEAFSIGRSATLTFGAEPDRLGLLHYLSLVNSSDCSIEKLEAMKGGAQEKRLVGGSQALSLRMAEPLADRIRLSCPVRAIRGWDKEVVELQTDQGLIRARQVVAALNPALCNQIAFDPPLPEGRAQLQRQWPQAAMRKTVHVYLRPFWRDAGLNGQVTQVEGPLLWCCDNSPADGSVGVINAFVRPGMLTDGPKATEHALSGILAAALGEAALHPIGFFDIDWSTVDPWSLTCTAPAPPGFTTRWGRFLRPPVGRLIWSGTETAEVWATAMDGAVRAGRRAALQALSGLSQARAV